MYSYIEGEITELTPTYVVIDVNGVGYFLNISLNTYSKLRDKQRYRLLTHLVVREDAQLLYGFAGEAERRLFRHLISVSGVGSNTARLILSSMTTVEIADAIVTGNHNTLQKVKGIGGKTAQRIIVDLRDRLWKEDMSPEKVGTPHNTKKDEALSGLIILGFNKTVAEKAIDKVITTGGSSLSVEQIIKSALKIL